MRMRSFPSTLLIIAMLTRPAIAWTCGSRWIIGIEADSTRSGQTAPHRRTGDVVQVLASGVVTVYHRQEYILMERLRCRTKIVA